MSHSLENVDPLPLNPAAVLFQCSHSAVPEQFINLMAGQELCHVCGFLSYTSFNIRVAMGNTKENIIRRIFIEI